jgi:hypothetical protein
MEHWDEDIAVEPTGNICRGDTGAANTVCSTAFAVESRQRRDYFCSFVEQDVVPH